jgi:toxin ParE1/3/4
VKYILTLSPRAGEDIDEAALFLAEDSLRIVLRFYDNVQKTLSVIAEHPNRFPLYPLSHPRLQQIRKYTVIGFKNYLIFYHIKQNRIEIIRILHGARDIPSILSE